MKYHLLNPIGRGGYGTVYKARESGSTRLFAVKVMKASANPRDESMAVAYRGEGCILPNLKHSHIIRQYFSQGWDTPRVEIVFALMEGTLHNLGTNHSPHRRPQLANEVLRQMLSALAYLNKKGYVHRDVKPDNIFYDSTGHHTHHFRLGDFGLCELGSVVAAEDGGIIGTERYLAPELHRDQRRHRCQTHKSDVWALFVTVLWAAEGDALWKRVGESSSLDFRYRLSATATVNEDLRGLRHIGRTDPSERVTAGEMERILAVNGPAVLRR